MNPQLDQVAHTAETSPDWLPAELYRQLRELAAAHFRAQPRRHTLQPTAVVHEVFLRLFKEREEGCRSFPQDETHLLALAAKIMRQVLVDHARARRRLKRNRGAVPVPIDAAELVASDRTPVDVLHLHELLEQFAAMDPRAARVVELRFFAGLTIAQVARVLGVSDFTVERDWRAARAWLAAALQEGE